MELFALGIIVGTVIGATVSAVMANNKIKELKKEKMVFENKIRTQNQEIENANGTITKLKNDNDELTRELENAKYDFESQMAYVSEEVRILELQLEETSEQMRSFQDTGKVDIETIKSHQEFLDKHIELSLNYMDKLIRMQSPKVEEELSNVVQEISSYRLFQKENFKKIMFDS